MTSPNALAQSMAKAIDLLTALQALLDDERAALGTRDAEKIQALLSKKTALLAQVQHNSNERSQCLIAAGVSNDEAGLLCYIDTLPAATSAPLRSQWQQLKTRLQDCQTANQVNGTIVHRAQAQVDALLSIVRGQSTQEKLYDDAGKTAAVGSGKTLGKA